MSDFCHVIRIEIVGAKFWEKLLQKVLFTCTFSCAEKHVTCERFENAASRAKTNVIVTDMTVHFTEQ